MITEKLNEEFEEGRQSEDCFEFRAVSENAYQVLQETITRIDEIVSRANFQDVDEEIKSEGVAIRKILKDAKEALDQHSEFLNWVQPTESE